jgi:hypothetical protein
MARMLGESGTHRCGLDLSLKIGDQLCVSLRFPVHGILKALDQPLQVRDPRLQRREGANLWIAGVGVLSIPGRGHAAHLADPRDQAFAIAHRHRFAGRFG